MLFRLILLFMLHTTVSCINCGKVFHTGVYYKKMATIRKKPLEEVHPWTVVIGNKLKSGPRCLGSLVVKNQFKGNANSTDLVVTSSRCARLRKLHYVVVDVKEDGTFSMDKKFRKPIKHIKKYKQKRGSRKMKKGVAVLTLKKPVHFGEEKSAICVGVPGWQQPQMLPCFMPLYNKKTKRIETWPIEVQPMRVCTTSKKLLKSGGYCGEPLYVKEAKIMGAPLMCSVEGIMYQFGVHADRISKKKVGSRLLYVDVTRDQYSICGYEAIDHHQDEESAEVDQKIGQSTPLQTSEQKADFGEPSDTEMNETEAKFSAETFEQTNEVDDSDSDSSDSE